MPLVKAWAVLSPKPEEAFQLVTSADFIYYYNCIIPFHALNHLLARDILNSVIFIQTRF